MEFCFFRVKHGWILCQCICNRNVVENPGGANAGSPGMLAQCGLLDKGKSHELEKESGRQPVSWGAPFGLMLGWRVRGLLGHSFIHSSISWLSSFMPRSLPKKNKSVSMGDSTKIFVASLFILVKKEKCPCIYQRRKNKQTIVYSYNTFLFSHKREHISDRYSVDESHRNYAGWKKTDTKSSVFISPSLWGSGNNKSNFHDFMIIPV